MMSSKIALMAALLAVPAMAAPVKKQEWVRVGSYVDGGPVEVDKKSIFTSAGLTRAWWRTTFAEPRQNGTVREQQLMAVDCGAGESTVLAVLGLDAEDNVVSDVREPEGAALHRLGPVTPGTTGELVAKAACDLRPRPKRR